MDVIRNNTKGLDGLAQLQSLLDAVIQPPIGRTLSFSLVEIERGRAASQSRERILTPSPETRPPGA